MSAKVRLLVALASVLLPWRLRRAVLRSVLKFDLDPECHIGLSLVAPRELLTMSAGTRIGHFNVIWKLDRLEMERGAQIAHFNWISAIPSDSTVPRFEDIPDRQPLLRMGECAGISQRHYFDCSDAVTVAPFATIGGVRPTFLTHHVDFERGRQFCAPIRVGEHSFVSTNCVLLGGATLPDQSILGARSLMLDSPAATHRLYAGTPAVEVKKYPKDLSWFQRRTFRSY